MAIGNIKAHDAAITAGIDKDKAELPIVKDIAINIGAIILIRARLVINSVRNIVKKTIKIKANIKYLIFKSKNDWFKISIRPESFKAFAKDKAPPKINNVPHDKFLVSCHSSNLPLFLDGIIKNKEVKNNPIAVSERLRGMYFLTSKKISVI